MRITSNCSSNYSKSDKGVFFLIGPEGSYQGEASSSGYKDKSFSFTLVDGSTTYVEFPMEKDQSESLEPDNCTAEQAIHNNETLSLLRNFRDDFLRKTPEGEFYIKAYYVHTEELSKIIISNPLLKQQFVRLIEDTTPVIKSLINKEQTVILKKQKKEITAFLNKVHTQSSPDLKNIIQKIKTKLMSGELGP